MSESPPLNEGAVPEPAAPPAPPAMPEAMPVQDAGVPDKPVTPSDSEIYAAKFLPQGQGYAPPPVAPPHPYDFYGAQQQMPPRPAPRPAVPMPASMMPPPPFGAAPGGPGFAQPMPQYAPGYAPPMYPQPGGPMNYGPRPPSFGYAPPYVPAKPMSGKGIASLVLGVTHFVFVFTAVIAAPIGLILAFMSMRDTRPDGPYQGRGFAIGGLVTNLLGLGMCLLVGLAVGGAIWAEQQEKDARYEREIDADFTVVRARLHEYYQNNGQSLGPGGEAPAAISNPEVSRKKVDDQLRLSDLVVKEDLKRRIRDYSFSVTGRASARMTHVKTGRELQVTDIALDSYYISPGKK